MTRRIGKARPNNPFSAPRGRPAACASVSSGPPAKREPLDSPPHPLALRGHPNVDLSRLSARQRRLALGLPANSLLGVMKKEEAA